MLGFFKQIKSLNEFKKLPAEYRKIVFYSEGSGDWPHLGPIIKELLHSHNQKISYLTSDSADPGLSIHHPHFRSFNIGSGTARTILFHGIEAKNFIMTIPDLDNMQLKRSTHKVHYIYLFHSINSTHTVYRQKAFDAFDTIFCVGPHHVEEIRRTEKIYGLKPKRLINHGSCKLDSVIETFAKVKTAQTSTQQKKILNILLAPSWGECSFIENNNATKIIKNCLQGENSVTLRLHPMTVRRLPRLILQLEREFCEHNFKIEKNMNVIDSWINSDVMISDWSGAAIEYSFALQKPVIYINTPQKINNPEWQKIGLPGVEDLIRYEIGAVVNLDDLEKINSLLSEISNENSSSELRRAAIRNKYVFNIGTSTQVAAREIVRFT